MKATGVVRRIDDLGRIVIPKEIRRTMRMREGDPLEIFTGQGGEIIFKKYSMMAELSQFSQSYAESLYRVSGMHCVVFDSDRVVAFTGMSSESMCRHEGLLPGWVNATTLLAWPRPKIS